MIITTEFNGLGTTTFTVDGAEVKISNEAILLAAETIKSHFGAPRLLEPILDGSQPRPPGDE